MYKRCVTEQSARRQREIEHGLLEILSTVRYETITIIDLCQSLNIPRKTFYRYFSSKEGALYALIDHTIMEFFSTIISKEPITFQTLNRFFEFWYGHQQLVHVAIKNHLSGILLQRVILQATQEATGLGMLSASPTLSEKYQIVFIVSGLMSMVLQWYDDHFSQSPKEMAVTAAQLLLEPLYQTQTT